MFELDECDYSLDGMNIMQSFMAPDMKKFYNSFCCYSLKCDPVEASWKGE